MKNHKRGQVVASAAEVYEDFFVPALFGEWPARVLKAAKVQGGNSVLDVGCGTGILAREAINFVGSSGSVTGVDINEGMLTVARQKGPNISWKVGTAESLPFEARAFDRVVSQFSLMFFVDQVKAISEMRRVVRPGGQICVAVWASLESTPGYAAVADVLKELFGSEVVKSIEAPYSLGDTQVLSDLFASAGEKDFEIQTVAGKARFKSVESWIYTDIKGWTLADVIDDDDFEKLRREAPKKLAQFMLPDSSVEFDAPAHIVTVAA